MPTTTLSEVQRLILTTAATREDWSVFPLSNAADTKRQTRSLRTLLSRELIKQVPAASEEQTWKRQDDKPISLVLTRAGRGAIGRGATDNQPTEPVDEQGSPDSAGSALASEAAAEPATTRSGTKQALVLELLGREEGATLDQLVTATGWLPHTTRAALTGLRKKGHAVESAKEDGVRTYRLMGAAS